MNKKDLINSISAKSGLSKVDAGLALEALVASVTESLVEGERVSLVGFGAWTVEQRDARLGRNPRTGEQIPIAAKRVIKFKPGAGLVKTVNASSADKEAI